MNHHKKIAWLVVPFLMIGGFVLSDVYLAHQAEEPRVFSLIPQGKCNVSQNACVLKSGEFEINLGDHNGISSINSTFPLDRATLFIVDTTGNTTAYRLGMKDSPYYWYQKTMLSENLKLESVQRLRVIVEIKGGSYIAEFYTESA